MLTRATINNGIVFLQESKEIPIVTGFMIGVDRLTLTAGHVIDEAYSYRAKRQGKNGQTYEHWEFYDLYLTNKPINGGLLFCGLYPIDNFWRPNGLIIRLWYLRPAYSNGERIKIPICKLTFNIPKICSEIMGFGCFNIKVDYGKKPLSVTHYQETAHTFGKVIVAHQVKRDSVMRSFTSFETDARFDSGMSGGPLFNELGNVCGIICSSFNSSNDGEHISFASLLWPLLGVSIRVSLETVSKLTNV